MTVDRKLQAMFDDPDLTGDLLLIAITMLMISRRYPGTDITFRQVAVQTGLRGYTLEKALRDDVPRYQPPHNHWGPCEAPRIRTSGICGAPGNGRGYNIDPSTGARFPIVRCSRHNTPDLERQVEAARQQWIANGSPTPPHNAGGILARHFPDRDFQPVHEYFAPGHKLTPGAGKPIAPGKKHLILVAGATKPPTATTPPGDGVQVALFGEPQPSPEPPKLILIRGDQP